MIDLETLMLAAKMGGGGGGGGSDPEAVKFTEQTLTSEQKAQARQNIGAAESGSGTNLVVVELDPTDDFSSAAVHIDGELTTLAEIKDLIYSGNVVVADVNIGGGNVIRGNLLTHGIDSDITAISFCTFVNSPVDGKLSFVNIVVADDADTGKATGGFEFISIENS